MSSLNLDVKKYICERCLYLIENFGDDLSNISKEEVLKRKSRVDCNFCFGIFEFDLYKDLISEVKRKIVDYDHTDFKFSFSFSFIFDFVHYFWKLFFKKNKEYKIANTSLIEPNSLKLTLKHIFVPYLAKEIHETFNLESDLKLDICFEFPQSIYDEVNAMFKYLNKNFVLNPSDKQKTNIGLKPILDMPNSLLLAVFQKFEFYNIASRLNPKVGIDKVLTFVKDPLYLKGNYNKFSREIGQSPWEINGERVCSSSVEEEMKFVIIKKFEADDLRFSAGGREDRDVRMLGKGRPFMVEILNPKKNIEKEIKNIEEEINKTSKYIKISNLEKCNKEYIDFIKKAEVNKMKIYSCFVWTKKQLTDEDINKLNNIKNMDVVQKTPLRVLHRRSLMDRNKKIFGLKAEKVSEHFMILDVIASAGTYIKEFVHSDLMRTEPSIKTLLNCDVDILQLDVRDLILIDEVNK
jgi:tRNA U54 and U55 pseudouridine synthase Pus10